MKFIVAVDEKWGIGKKNGLLFSIPADMKFFREKTANKVVCLGYNTLLSFPNSKPLKNRINIVLAPAGVVRDDCIIVYTLEELSIELKKYPSDDIYIIGGAMFYRTMYKYCSSAYITKVHADGEAEVFFDNIDKLDNWSYKTLYDDESNGYKLTFTEYTNSCPIEF